MNIRVVQREDFENVERLAKEVQKMHIEWRPDIYTLESDIFSKEFFESIVDNEKMYVAEENGNIKGFILYEEKNYDIDNQIKRTTYCIDAVAVDKEWQGHGIGTKLIDKIKEIAKEKGVAAIELQVNAKNTTAKGMYEKYGFCDKSINMEMRL